MSERSVQFTFKMPAENRYIGPPSIGAGIAKVRETGVKLSYTYQTENLDEDTDGGPWDIGLDVYEIRSVRFKSGFLGTRLIIETEDPSKTEEIPGSHNGTVILRIPAGEGEAARQAESLLALGLAQK